MLEWDLKYGNKKSWFEQLASEGTVLKPYEQKVDLYPDLTFHYEAFCVLSSARTAGFNSYNPIPLSEVKSYMEMFGVESYEAKKIFLKRIKILDNTFLAWHQEQSKNAK